MAAATVPTPSVSTPPATLRVTERVGNSEFYQGHMDSITVPPAVNQKVPIKRRTSRKPSKQSSTLSSDAAALERMVIARGPNSKARVNGNGSLAGAIGPKATAIASGIDAVAVAGGKGALAHLEKGDDSAAVAAAGIGCVAECLDGFADMAAVGTGATAISHEKNIAAVAVGFAAFAIAPDEGTAISIGLEAAAMAGHDGYLIFIDTSATEPAVKIVKADFARNRNSPKCSLLVEGGNGRARGRHRPPAT
jgi:hypothetical protein